MTFGCPDNRLLLAGADLALAQVADLLGFVDQSNFFRASKRWFGMPPGQYRVQKAAVNPGPGL